jgi:hypothetical protein
MKTYKSQCREIKMDDCDYLVTFDFQPEEKPVYDLNSPMCGPGCAAEVSITNIDVRPHGYPTWLQTDIAKWDAESNLWSVLESECEVSMQNDIEAEEEAFWERREEERLNREDFDCRR